MKNFLSVFGRKSNPYFNHEGYPDPTAYYALKSSEGEELHELVQGIKDLVAQTDFEIVGRIKFKSRKSGRIFR